MNIGQLQFISSSLFIGNKDHADRLRLSCYPDADVILMCFSIDNPNTLKNIEKNWIQQVKLYCPTGTSIIVHCKKWNVMVHICHGVLGHFHINVGVT